MFLEGDLEIHKLRIEGLGSDFRIPEIPGKVVIQIIQAGLDIGFGSLQEGLDRMVRLASRTIIHISVSRRIVLRRFFLDPDDASGRSTDSK